MSYRSYSRLGAPIKINGAPVPYPGEPTATDKLGSDQSKMHILSGEGNIQEKDKGIPSDPFVKKIKKTNTDPIQRLRKVATKSRVVKIIKNVKK